MASPAVSILILNYNGEKFIAPCLASVLAQDYPNREVLLIDNASHDGSLALARERFPGVRLLANKENYGFSKAINLGIDATDGELLLVLNVDVVLAPTFLREMVVAIQKEPVIGSVSGKIYRAKSSGPPVIDSTGHLIFRNRLFIDRGDEEADRGQYDREEEIFGACAGAGLYRRAMLEDVKVGDEYFDEAFFLFLEDVDLNWRAQLRGWKCLYTPRAIVYHHRGGVAIRRTELVERHNYKNRYFVLLKNDSFLSILRDLPHFIITDALKSGALLFRCPPALLGWVDVIRNLPAMWRKRRLIQKRRTVGRREFERWFQPFDYGRWVRRHLRGF